MMVKTIISSNTAAKCHFDPHLLLLSAHVKLDSTIATALELNVLVFLSSLFVYFKQHAPVQPVKQPSNDDLTVKPFTGNKLTKRKILQKGVQPVVNKPPSGYLSTCNSREGLIHTVSDSSLCAHRVNTSSSASSISLIDFNKDPSGKVKHNMGNNKGSNKQQITASSESLNMAQFETHTSLRIKRPPSGQMTKECFVNKETKNVSFQENVSTDTSVADNPSANESSDHEQDKKRIFATCHNNNGNQQLQSTAIIVDRESYHWLVKTLSLHGVTLKGDNELECIPADVQDVPMVSCIQMSSYCIYVH